MKKNISFTIIIKPERGNSFRANRMHAYENRIAGENKWQWCKIYFFNKNIQ